MTKISTAFSENGGLNTLSNQPELPAKRVSGLIDSYLLACDIARHYQCTLESRRERLSRLSWLAQREKWDVIGLQEIRRFFIKQLRVVSTK